MGDTTSTSIATGSGDTPVSQSQLNQAMAQVARMQQETMQNVAQMQASLQHLVSLSPPSLSGVNVTASSSSIPNLVAPTASIPGYIKLAKPSLFSGAVKTNVETWLFEVEQYLLAYGVNNESQRIAFAAASFKGLALQWWQNHCLLHPGLGLTWGQFKDEVRKRFQPVEASRTARVNLRSLKQGNKSVQDYCSAFYEQLQSIHDMSEADKVENFMMGLNSSIYAEVDRRDPLNLQDAMMYAQRTEIRSRVRAVQRGNNYEAYKTNRFYNRYRSSGQEKSVSNNESSSTTSGPAPMELGKLGMNEEEEDQEALELEWKEYLNEFEAEEHQEVSDGDEEESKVRKEEQEEDSQLHAININRRQLPKEEFIRLRKEGKCFHCKQSGHWSRECPNISRPPRRNGGRQSNSTKY
jgi:hypothetical protein